MSAFKTWFRPEVFPLFLTVGGGIVICGAHIARTFMSHNDIQIKKGRPFQYIENESPKYIPRNKAVSWRMAYHDN